MDIGSAQHAGNASFAGPEHPSAPATTRGLGLPLAWTLNGVVVLTVVLVLVAVTLSLGHAYLWVEEATGLVLVLGLSAALLVTNRLLVGRPLSRLRRGLRLMAAGYPDALLRGWEASEWREIAREIRALHQELEETVRDLVEAERTGLTALVDQSDGHLGTASASLVEASRRPVSRDAFRELLLHHLRNKARVLETGDPRDPTVRTLAHEVWEEDVHELERLGEIPLRSRLDDAALRVLEPKAYATVTAYLRTASANPTRWVRRRRDEVAAALRAHEVDALRVVSRTKHAAGVWRKARRLGLPVEQISDVFGLRVIVEDEPTCYRALHALHAELSPLPLQFKDYIRHPKSNGYRSLHTRLRAADGAIFEVQIRSAAMHDSAERGEAAHWKYKRKQNPAPR